MANNRELKTITLPKRLFNSLIEIQRKWEEFNDEFEDLLFSLDRRFIKKMERARREHLRGKIKDLQKLKQKLY